MRALSPCYTVLARLAVGDAMDPEFCGAGTIVVEFDPSLDGRQFRVYVDGGYLPDGQDERRFIAPRRAMEFACAIAVQRGVEEAQEVVS